MASNAAVRITEAVIVTPSEKTPCHVLSLSALDSQPFLRFTIEYLLIYHPSPSIHRTLTVARFKSALARTLARYYPLAGRVRQSATSRDGGSARLEVVCEAQGAVFVQATSDFTSADLDRAPCHVGEWRKLLWLHSDDVLRGSPPLIVQLTWLADGSAALAFGFNHCLIDGIGSSEFLKSLAESTHGLYKTVAEPVPWERHLLEPEPVRVKPSIEALHSHPEFSRIPDLCGFLERFSTKPLTPTSTVISSMQIKELKRRASPPNQTLTHTTFEVVAAHVWTCWARALRLPPNQTLRLLFSVNIRSRFGKPGLPAGYYGNGFVLGCAKSSAREVCEKGIWHAAELIRKAKERVDEGYVREVVEMVSQSRPSRPDSVGVLVLSQWSRLGLDGIDLFGLGKAVNVGPVCVDRYCLLLPGRDRRDRSSVKVMVALPVVAVDVYRDLMRI